MYREQVRKIRHADKRTFAVLCSSHDGAYHLSELYSGAGRMDGEQREIKYRIHGRPGRKISRLPADAVLHEGDFYTTDVVAGETIMFFIDKIFVLSRN